MWPRTEEKGWTPFEKSLVSLAQRVPRRSFMRKVGAGVLAGLGVSILEQNWPNFAPDPALASQCGDSFFGCAGSQCPGCTANESGVWCGLCGVRCNNSDCGGTATSCPGFAPQAGGWTACCCVPFINGCLRLTVTYYDCCKTVPGNPCPGPKCCNSDDVVSPQPAGHGACPKGVLTEAYCGGSPYWCTFYAIHSGDPC
jgi:hypothetical protein